MKIPKNWINTTYKNDELESYVFNDFIIFVNLETSPKFTIQSLKDYEECKAKDLFKSNSLKEVQTFLT